jgi:hypothetical protein
MAYFIVTYDLKHASEVRYEHLIDYLKILGAHHTQESVWLVDWAGTAGGLYDQLRTHMHQNDLLLVLQFFSNSTWKSFSFQGTREWLNARCGPSS